MKILSMVPKKLLAPTLLVLTTWLLSFDTFRFTGIIRHDVPIEKYREMASLPEFDCVGRYSISETDSSYAGGVLIAPKWVLTASHFVQDSSVWSFGNVLYKSSRIVMHPKLKQLPASRKKQWDGWDLALVELEKSVAHIKPAVRYRGRSELGRKVFKIGYGYIGNGLVGQLSPVRQERLGGNNVIDSIGGLIEGIRLGEDVLVSDFDGPHTTEFNQCGSSIPLDYEIGGSKGDSGGGVFIEHNGEMQLVGIVSGAINRELGYGSVMLFARVSSANEWIDSVVD